MANYHCQSSLQIAFVSPLGKLTNFTIHWNWRYIFVAGIVFICDPFPSFLVAGTRPCLSLSSSVNCRFKRFLKTDWNETWGNTTLGACFSRGSFILNDHLILSCVFFLVGGKWHWKLCITFVLRKVRDQKFRKYDNQLPLGVGLVLVNIQSNELRGDNKQKRHFFERLSVTLQWENGTMLLKRCPLPTADVDGEL